MKRALPALILSAALLHPGRARAHGISALGAYADGMAEIFGVALELGLLIPFATAAIDAGNRERLSTGHAVVYATTGTFFGAFSSIFVLGSARSGYDRSSHWLSATLTPTLLGLGGLGLGAFGDRPRDAWIGASSAVSAFVLTHAVFVWTSHGNHADALAMSVVFGSMATVGSVALAAIADDDVEAASLATLAGLTLVATVSQAVWMQRLSSATNPALPCRASWSVAPAITAGGTSLTLQGSF